MKIFSLLSILLICFVTSQSEAQIWAPEGLNMPGAYGAWSNPPSISAFKSSNNGGGLINITTGTPRYQTSFSAAASGGDVVGGTYEFLFTSGPSTNYFANKWSNVVVNMNALQSYTFQHATNNSVTFVNGKSYTMNWIDSGYANTSAIFMETSSAPISILWATDNFRQQNQPITVTIKTSAQKSPEEKLFVRYTTDNWATSFFVEALGTGTLYTAIIPANGVSATTNNSYYVLTTTVGNPTHSNADMITIRANNNYGSNYRIFDKFLTVDVSNVEATGAGPIMFSTPTVGAPNCLNYLCGDPNGSTIRAYTGMRYNLAGLGPNGQYCNCTNALGIGVATSSAASAQQTNVLNATAGITLNFGDASLAGFISNCPTSDRRVYTGLNANIKKDGIVKLAFLDYRFNLNVVYATGITGDGFARIDVANSDPRWIAEFDPYNTGQVQVDVVSFSSVTQFTCFGQYNITYKVKPSIVTYHQGTGTLANQGTINETFNFPASKVSINFTSATFGSYQGGNNVYVNEILDFANGTKPIGIDATGPCYWDIATTLASFTASITFDVSDAGTVLVPSNLRILRRDNPSSPWSVYTNFTLVDNTHIRANNVTAFGEWTIGSTGGNPLPVELTSFSAGIENNYVTLKWNTATETGSSLFEVERKNDANCEIFSKVGSINAAGYSDLPKSYKFSDKVNLAGKYQYRLKLINLDGSSEYCSPVMVDINKPIRFDLAQNYPNPFNPSTTITYTVAEKAKVILELFDVLGSKIETLVNDEKEAGIYSIEFNANNFASGTYFYKITAGNFVATKKMNLIK